MPHRSSTDAPQGGKRRKERGRVLACREDEIARKKKKRKEGEGDKVKMGLAISRDNTIDVLTRKGGREMRALL